MTIARRLLDKRCGLSEYSWRSFLKSFFYTTSQESQFQTAGKFALQTAYKTKMTIPPKLLKLVEQLTNELERTEQQANKGLSLASQLLERFPNNARLIGLSANLGNVLFFVSSFRNWIESRIGEISGSLT